MLRSDLDLKTAVEGLSGPSTARRATLPANPHGPHRPGASPATSVQAREIPLPAKAGSVNATAQPDRVAPKQPLLETGPAYTFENFVVGPCNALAREAAFAMAHQQQQNLAQLYLCADSGMGKTHLARAVAAEASRVGSRAVQYVSAEGFTNQFLASLRSNMTGDFKKAIPRAQPTAGSGGRSVPRTQRSHSVGVFSHRDSCARHRWANRDHRRPNARRDGPTGPPTAVTTDGRLRC